MSDLLLICDGGNLSREPNVSYPETMTIEEFAERTYEARAEFASLWDELSASEMTRRPGPQEDWSVKDLIVHLTWWEQSAISRVKAMRNGKIPVVYEDFDAVNSRIWEAHKDDSLENVLTAFAVSWNDLEDLFDSLSDEEFNRDNGDFRSFYQLLGGNTIGHYADHRPDLEWYVDSLK
jgi:hypothetical protein